MRSNDKADERRELLKKQYSDLNSDECKEFTDGVLLLMGQEIERKYPNVRFFLKLRYKSEDSYFKKIDKVMQRENVAEQQIYDGIGFCLVIEHIPNAFTALDDDGDKYEKLKKALAGRANRRTEIVNKEFEIKNVKQKFDEEYIDFQEMLESAFKERNLELTETKIEDRRKYIESLIDQMRSQGFPKEKVDRIWKRFKFLVNEERERIDAIKEQIELLKELHDRDNNAANRLLAGKILADFSSKNSV